MGKGDFLTPKAIANRIKAKGLLKLRWYCQLCQKQCRDANGFKCHIESESHQRQMGIFTENPNRMLTNYSDEFEKDFTTLLRLRYRSKRIHANVVYNEYIADRHHVHMNSTKWETLTEFIKYLGRSGQCVVDETPKGWYVTYIDRSPEMLAKMDAKNRRERHDMDEVERNLKLIEMQIELAKAYEEARASGQNLEEDEDTDGTDATDDTDAREDIDFKEQERIVLNLFKQVKKESDVSTVSEGAAKERDPEKVKLVKSIFDEEDESDVSTSRPGSTKSEASGSGHQSEEKRLDSHKRKHSVIEKMIREDQIQKERRNRSWLWLTPGIVVKILNQKLADGKFYKQKAVVLDVDKEGGIGLIRLVQGNTKIKIHQDELETVIPQIGGNVLIVNGGNRGLKGTLLSINIDAENVDVKVSDISGTRILKGIPYEDVCKVA